jgi:hypothetical protein
MNRQPLRKNLVWSRGKSELIAWQAKETGEHPRHFPHGKPLKPVTSPAPALSPQSAPQSLQAF